MMVWVRARYSISNNKATSFSIVMIVEHGGDLGGCFCIRLNCVIGWRYYLTVVSGFGHEAWSHKARKDHYCDRKSGYK